MRETYRDAWVDFTQIPTLCRKAGCPRDKLARVAAKELIDNALDASPRGIEVHFHDRTLVVSDCGPGLSEARVLAIFDIKRSSLSAKRWRHARRGALGNGTRVVMGVVHVSRGCLDVEAHGIGLRLTVRADGQTVADRFASEITEGTRISITFGPDIDFDAAEIMRYAELCHSAAGSAFGGTKSVPSWFDPLSLRELIRDMPGETSVLEFAKLFDLTDEALADIKAKAMRTTTGELLIDEEQLGIITDIILAGQKGNRQLRRMGRNARPGAYAHVDSTFRLGQATLPVVVEVWAEGSPVADRKTDGKIRVGTIFANRTPALMAGSSGHVSSRTKDADLWVGNHSITIELNGPCDFAVEIAITAPELPLLSDGKAIDIGHFSRSIATALQDALRRAYVAPLGKVEKKEADKKVSIKDAVYELIPDVYDSVAAAGIGAPPRMLMYRCRPGIYRLTGRNELNYQTFKAHLEAFMDDNPEATKDWSILYDDRGHFIEPSGDIFGLGTLAVENFIGRISDQEARFLAKPEFDIECSSGLIIAGNNPAHRFSAVVFIEKEGYFELIRKANIAKRFDVAFASSKGMPTRAIRRLLDALTSHGIKTFCLHDCDINGLGIAHNLSTSNERYEFQNDLDFVDMGVRLVDAEALNLESEPFKLGKVDRPKLINRLKRYGATSDEIKMLVDRQRRVEIDAMTPKQLIDFIETKLAAQGVGKVLPDETTLEAYFRQAEMDIRLQKALAPIRTELAKRFADLATEMNGAAADVPPLQSRVREIMEKSPEKDWKNALLDAVSESMSGAT